MSKTSFFLQAVRLLALPCLVLGALTNAAVALPDRETEIRTAASCPAPGTVKSNPVAAPSGAYPNITFKNSSFVRLAIYLIGNAGGFTLIGTIGPGESLNSGGSPTIGEKYLAVDPDGRCIGGVLEKDPGNDLIYALFGDAVTATPGLAAVSLTDVAACPSVSTVADPKPAGQAANVTVENKTGAPVDIFRILPDGTQLNLLTLADQKRFNTGGSFGPAVRLFAKTASGQCIGKVITAINQRATTVTLAARLETNPQVAPGTIVDVLNETVTTRLDCPAAGTIKSVRGSGEFAVSFINKTNSPLSVIWLHYDGSRTSPHALPVGSAMTIGGFGGMEQAYLVIDQAGKCLGGVLKPKAARQTQYTLQ